MLRRVASSSSRRSKIARPERLVGLMQPALALAPELLPDVPVGDGRDDAIGQQRAADEQQEQATAEPALERRAGAASRWMARSSN